MTGPRVPPGDDAPSPEVREDAMRPVGSRGMPPGIVVLLVVGAVALGVALVKPWELPGEPGAMPGTSGLPAVASRIPSRSGAPAEADPRSLSPDAAPGSCAAPQSWRTATIETWFGRQARVWSAAEVAETAPDDPTLPFEPIVAERVMAIGWCAPVLGPERPPLAARARLWILGAGGPVPHPYRRLEPAGPDPLGELWVPVGRRGRTTAGWAPGRYVIELRTPTGGWARFLGLEVRSPPPEPSAAPPGGVPASATPAEREASPTVPPPTAPAP